MFKKKRPEISILEAFSSGRFRSRVEGGEGVKNLKNRNARRTLSVNDPLPCAKIRLRLESFTIQEEALGSRTLFRAALDTFERFHLYIIENGQPHDVIRGGGTLTKLIRMVFFLKISNSLGPISYAYFSKMFVFFFRRGLVP